MSDPDTDPDVFKSTERTARRCPKCGTEIEPDDGSFRRGAIHILATIRDLLEERGEMPLAAEEIAHAIAVRAGITLI
jgi:hypothetical protein